MILFVYGTLLFDGVMHQVVQGRYRFCPACITGYRRVKVKGQTYPALIKGNGTVDGRLFFDITPEDLSRLDAFEGIYYDRRPVTAVTDKKETFNADVYELNPQHYGMIADEPWLPEDFEQRGLTTFLRTYFGFDRLEHG